MSQFSMPGRTVVITGAASGIGLATAQRLAKAGADVVMADIADATDSAARIGGRFVPVDVTDEQSVADLMHVAAENGPVHGVVLAAGIDSEQTIDCVELQQIQQVMNVNCYGVLFGLKHAPRHMPEGGAIVTIGSLAASVGLEGYAAYAASKAAVLALSRVAAVELGPRHIRVNAICPASVDTPMLHQQANGAVEATLTRIASPLGALSTANHVAALAHFLLAEDCPQISGQAINIDGGWTAGCSIDLIERIVGTDEVPTLTGAHQ